MAYDDAPFFYALAFKGKDEILLGKDLEPQITRISNIRYMGKGKREDDQKHPRAEQC